MRLGEIRKRIAEPLITVLFEKIKKASNKKKRVHLVKVPYAIAEKIEEMCDNENIPVFISNTYTDPKYRTFIVASSYSKLNDAIKRSDIDSNDRDYD